MTDNINMVSLSPSSVPLNQVREKFTKDGFVFPLQIFPDNSFLEKGYADKYKDFRKKCEVERLIPITPTETGDKERTNKVECYHSNYHHPVYICCLYLILQ